MKGLAKFVLAGCGVLIILGIAARNEAPPTPPLAQSAAPAWVPNPYVSMPAPQLFEHARGLARRMAAENRPGLPIDGPFITKAEMSGTEAALSNIPQGTPEYRTARRLLALLVQREDEGKRAMDAYTAKEAAKDRKDYASPMERLLLEGGMDAVVTASGPGATTLTVRYVLMNRPLVYKLVNDTDFIANRKKEGFRRAVFTDGYDRTWSYDLTK